jgi:uncharacterized protein
VDVSHPTIPLEATVGLAADVVLPQGRPAGGLPTVLIQTRYWRSFRMRGGGGPRIPQGPRDDIVGHLVEAGFAVVVVDVRGTGASDGVWQWPWSEAEVRDMGPVIDWIVAQPWSNGNVGATGVSYEGTTALLAATAHRPALKAVLARQIEWQLVDETIAPGGVRNALFADVWGRAVDDLDHGRYPAMFPGYAKWLVTGVAWRDDDQTGQAQRSREAARPTTDIAVRARAVYRGSDSFGVNAPATDSLGPAGHVAALAASRAVMGIWGSWWDGATADAVFRAIQAMPVTEAVIGPWTHEGDANASPLRRRSSAFATVELDSVVAFFSRHLRTAPNASVPAASVAVRRWYVAGLEQWRAAEQWPTTRFRHWPLAVSASVSVLRWQAEESASTGTNTRWTTGLARPVDVVDRAATPGVHSFTLAPLTDTLSVFGAGSFDCRIRSDQPEATLHVYLEAVNPNGRVTLMTEGMQRTTGGDSVSIRLRPVAFAVPPGWRLRVSLASDDRPTFERVPPNAPVTWTGDLRACGIALPVESTPK